MVHSTPWRYDAETGCVEDAEGHSVGYVSGRQRSVKDPQARATGNLLAAAPELHAAAKALEEHLLFNIAPTAGIVEMFRLAIAKADGHSPPSQKGQGE